MTTTSPLRLKYPVVLIPGLGARATYGPFDYFFGLPKKLQAAGTLFKVARNSPWQSIERRAEQLRDLLEKEFSGRTVNLVGHSMGGLDARYLASCLGFSGKIASITTIGTPHRGTVASDILHNLIPSPVFKAGRKILWPLDFSPHVFQQLTTSHCMMSFASRVPNHPGVAYFSATSAIPADFRRRSLPVFWRTHQMVKAREGDNDGFVSVESSKWGEHICTYWGDHYAQIGQLLGRSRGLDYLSFYDEIFGRLRREGF